MGWRHPYPPLVAGSSGTASVDVDNLPWATPLGGRNPVPTALQTAVLYESAAGTYNILSPNTTGAIVQFGSGYLYSAGGSLSSSSNTVTVSMQQPPKAGNLLIALATSYLDMIYNGPVTGWNTEAINIGGQYLPASPYMDRVIYSRLATGTEGQTFGITIPSTVGATSYTLLAVGVYEVVPAAGATFPYISTYSTGNPWWGFNPSPPGSQPFWNSQLTSQFAGQVPFGMWATYSPGAEAVSGSGTGWVIDAQYSSIGGSYAVGWMHGPYSTAAGQFMPSNSFAGITGNPFRVTNFVGATNSSNTPGFYRLWNATILGSGTDTPSIQRSTSGLYVAQTIGPVLNSVPFEPAGLPCLSGEAIQLVCGAAALAQVVYDVTT